MTYNSSSGSISSWVEKLQNIEAAIKVTQENLKRRANGLPPLPPPGLSHMQTKMENMSSCVVSPSVANPKGINAVNKPIIGLGRGKRFSKQNSLPVGEVPVSTVSAIPVGGTISSSVIGNGDTHSGEVLVQCQSWKPQLLSNDEIYSQGQIPKKQSASSSVTLGQNQKHQSGNSEIFNQDQPKIQQLASSSVVFGQDQLPSNSEIFNQGKSKKLSANSSQIFDHDQQLSSNSEIYGQDQLSSSELFNQNRQLLSSSEIYSQDQPKKQHMANSSEVFGQNQLQKLSSSINKTFNQNQLSNNNKEQSQEPVSDVASKQTLKNDDKTNENQIGTFIPITNGIARSFANLTLPNNAASFTPAVVTTAPIHLLPVTQVSVPISSRAMSYSSAVTSQPPRKPPPARPQQPFNRMPIMHQPLLPSPLQQPHMYGQNQPPVVGLGRGNGPWSAGPPPHSWGGNGHYMHKMPPPVHFNFDHHHHSPFYEIPSSGLHNPFYPIPPMGSSSGLDII